MITERQMMILQAIVRDYTANGQPVGSKSLAEQLPIHVSSATIRNEMAALEDKGLITKTHLSSGRIPSVSGYRMYVDHLTEPDLIQSTDRNLIKNSFDGDFQRIDDLVGQSAAILSDLTSYTALTLKPEQRDSRLTAFRVIPLGNHQAMAVIVIDDGTTETQTFDIDPNVSGDQLEAVSRMIDKELVGQTLGEVLHHLQTELPMKMMQYLKSPDGFISTFGDTLTKIAQDRFFVGGQLNMLNFSDTSNIDSVKALYRLFDQGDDLASVIGPPKDNDIQVQIGNEITNDMLKNFSLITTTYDAGEHGTGMIAILGPTRMPYSKMIGIMGAFREELAAKLLDYYRRLDE